MARKGRASAPKESLAERIIANLEQLIISQGEFAGENLKVLPWFRELIEAYDDHDIFALSMGRGNAKTTAISALSCSAIRPDGVLFWPRGDILMLAASLDQVNEAFRHIKHFLEPWTHKENDEGERELDRKTWKMADHHHGRSIEHRKTGTVLKTLGSDSNRAHGRAARIGILDEPAQWTGGGEKLYNAMVTGMGKQPNAKLFVIGTQSDNPEHWFQRLLRSKTPRVWTKVYAADRGDPDFDVKTLRKANPSYDHMPSLRRDIANKIEMVKDGSLSIHAFRALHLNMGTPETESREPIVTPDAWEAVETDHPAPREGPVAIGVDLGGGNSMTAIAFYWPDTGRLEARAAYPEEPNLLERGKRDGVGTLYQEMYEAGELELWGQYATDNVAFLKHALAEVSGFERIGMTADNWQKTSISQALYEMGMEPRDEIDHRRVGQGPSGKEDVEAFQHEVLTRYLSTGYNLCFEHAISRARLGRDRNGNPALDKSKQKGRIDVLQAGILAVGMGYRHRKPAKSNSVWAMYQSRLSAGKPLIESIR